MFDMCFGPFFVFDKPLDFTADVNLFQRILNLLKLFFLVKTPGLVASKVDSRDFPDYLWLFPLPSYSKIKHLS